MTTLALSDVRIAGSSSVLTRLKSLLARAARSGMPKAPRPAVSAVPAGLDEVATTALLLRN